MTTETPHHITLAQMMLMSKEELSALRNQLINKIRENDRLLKEKYPSMHLGEWE